MRISLLLVIQLACSAVSFDGVCCRATALTRVASHPQIVPQNDFWEIVVVTGKGSSANTHAGVSTLYTFDDDTGKMMRRGTVDRVCSGNTYYRIGWPEQGPGKIARVMVWNRVLNIDEIQQVANDALQGGCKKGEYTRDVIVITLAI